ncbi:hypothetical protein HIM_09704 [Hirsutella minnesotensis 3608]|uniref:Rhodopsin domain-containing protein n=1 Tax=Hirsutella minnesotensis 3608 TaxID=1043627 RepID=A0A0F7ZGH7_9HYPO|nr:hypothetical protein HIM_09704 [Hirsutella minnesotensis 3608]
MELIPRQAMPGVTPLQVSYTAFLAVIWTGVALPGLVLACRLYSRFRGPGRLFWDDGFVVFAWILVLLVAALWQWAAKDMYYVIDVQAGLAQFAPNFFERMSRWLRVSLIVELFFYTALVAIKLSFLFFFRRLGDGIHYFRYIWWPVLVITLGSYFGSVGNVNYKCLVGTTEEILGVCNTPGEIDWTTRTLQANCVLDVLTDFLIMLLPTILLWNTRVRWSKKLAIIGLFSLSIVTMVVAIVRTAMLSTNKRPDGNFDVSWLWLWSAVEPSVGKYNFVPKSEHIADAVFAIKAIVVCGLSAFPQLFTQSHRNKKRVYTPSETYLRMMSRIRSKKKRKEDSWLDLTTASQAADEDRSHVDHDLENGLYKNPVLVPNQPKPVVNAYRGNANGKGAGPRDQITQEVEFSMTEHKAG